MDVSVIIPVYNEENEILDCLESLGKQHFGEFEIIVVDDGSTDGTKKVISNLASKIPSIILLEQNHKGPGAARNLGSQKALGKVLVFVDADMTFDKNFLNNLTAPILKGKSKGSFSREEFVSNWENIWAKCWTINEGWEEKRRHPKNYPGKQKVFRAILKTEFKKAGGFTPGGYTDDYSLYQKLGYMAENAPGAVFYHKNPGSLSEVYKQARWAGKRPYKLGILGYFVALLRASLPVSAVSGLYKSVTNKVPAFVLFKIVYDFGVFSGLTEFLLTGKAAK